IELGVPFSDPIADGPTNQKAAERALASGTTLKGVLDLVADLRTRSDIPIVLFTYANPVMQFGLEAFASAAAASGIDGILFTDVPTEELPRFSPALTTADIDPILLITPTSGKARIKAASKAGSGFVYLVSRTGVTGAQRQLDPELEPLINQVQKGSKLPVAVGFGISDSDQVRQVAQQADGVVVGSAIVNQVASVGDSDELAPTIEAFVRPLVEACRTTGS
ncbi:MAG: tryptophan synthase subunit alpha, partial [Acidobacteriota bacterium]